jgi:hypothetical protein
MDKEYIRSYTDAIYQAQLDIGVVIAGGLSAENLEEVAAPLFKEFPGLSCDAEGRMRKGLKGETQLDLAKVEAYIKKWASIMTDLRF